MAKTRRRLRNENAKLKAEVARLQAELRKSRMPHFQGIPYFGQDPSRIVRDFSSMFIHSRYQVAPEWTVPVDMTPVSDEEIQKATAQLNEMVESRHRMRLMQLMVAAESTPAQKGESDVHK